MTAQLDTEAQTWEDAEHPGMWATGDFLPASLSPITALDPQTGHVVLGLNISVHRLTRPVRKVCEFLINDVIAFHAGADPHFRTYKLARDNVLSYLMPASIYVVTTAAERNAAFDQLERAMVLRVVLFESESMHLFRCERPALGDSVTITQSSVPSGADSLRK